MNTGLRAPTGYKKNMVVNNLGMRGTFNLSERPVTNHGMLGLKSNKNGPKRKVLSKSYFLVMLKKKNEELT